MNVMASNISWFVRPTAGGTSTLYTATGKDIITTILVSNTSTATTFSIRYIPSGQSVWDTYAFPKGAAILANDEIDFVRPITLSLWDTIQVSSASGNVSFGFTWQKY